MRRKWTAILLALTMTMSLVTVPAMATEETSNESPETSVESTETFVAKIGETSYTTVAAAFTNAAEGDTITLLAGTHDLITLGAIPDKLTITAEKGAVVKGIFFNSTDVSLEFTGLTVKNVDFQGAGLYFNWEGAGSAHWDKVTNLTMENCTFTADSNEDVLGNRLFDVGVDSPSSNQLIGCTITDCTATGGIQGIRLGGVAGTTVISNNTISGVAHNAIALRSIAANAKVTVSGNKISNGGDRAFRIGSQDASATVAYTNNTIVNTGDGDDGSNFKTNDKTGATVTFTGNTVDGFVMDDLTQAPPVAQVGDKTYTTLAEAIEAAEELTNPTINILTDITVDTWDQEWYPNGWTIKGNNHTLTIGKVDSNMNGDFLLYDATDLNVSNLTVKFTTSGNGFDMASGKLDNVTLIGGTESVTGVFVNAGGTVEVLNSTIKDFKTYGVAGDNEENASNIVVKNSAISNCNVSVLSFAESTVLENNTFTNNNEVSLAAGLNTTLTENKIVYTITGNTFVDTPVFLHKAPLNKVTFMNNKVDIDSAVNIGEGSTGTLTVAEPYFKADTMRDPQDLNTYVAPSGGGSSKPSTPAAPKPNTSSPTVSTDTKTDAATGSTTVTETKKDGTTVETTTNTDGSTSTSATKTEVKETSSGTTTTTATNTTTTTASGDKVTENKVEQVVEKKDGTSVATTTETKTQTASGTTVTEKTVEKTEVDADGEETTTATTTTKSSNGSTGTTTVAADGAVAAEVKVSSTAVKTAEKAEAPVTLPMPAVAAGQTAETAPTVAVSVPRSADSVAVEIPVTDVNPGTVVVMVAADGTETVVPMTQMTENGVAVTVTENVTMKVVDNSKDFTDVPETHTFADATDFASARGVVEGYADGSFGVTASATSAAAVTVVARTLGEQFYGATATTDASAWVAEKGLADGLDLTGAVDRGSYMVMLWRAAGQPIVDETAAGHFTDAGNLTDLNQAAMAWAVANGLIEGYPDGSVRPEGNITRGAMAAIAMRYIQLVG